MTTPLPELFRTGRFHEYRDNLEQLTDGWNMAGGHLHWAHGDFHLAAATYVGAAEIAPEPEDYSLCLAYAAWAEAFHNTDAARSWLIDVADFTSDVRVSHFEGDIIAQLAEAITVSEDTPGAALDLTAGIRDRLGDTDPRLTAYSWFADAYISGARYPELTVEILDNLTDWPWLQQIASDSFKCAGDVDNTRFEQIGWLDPKAISRWRSTLTF